MGLVELVMLLANWFMLSIIMLLTVKAIMGVKPFIEKVIVAKTMWYLYMAFGYSLISVAILTSWIIWFVGEIWGMFVLFMTWFILVIIFLAHKRVKEATLRKAFTLK